eukprot:scaffold119589_cov48-Phaeocystis_antarctica.AAC.1
MGTAVNPGFVYLRAGAKVLSLTLTLAPTLTLPLNPNPDPTPGRGGGKAAHRQRRAWADRVLP